MQLNKDQIKEVQQNREPYLMLDYVTNLVPGKLCDSYKDLNENEWFFTVHWPGDPNMPGMLQLEAISQISSLAVLTLPNNANKTMYLVSMNNIRFYKKVLPKEKILISSKIQYRKDNYFQFKGEIKVKRTLVCKVDFAMLLNN